MRKKRARMYCDPAFKKLVQIRGIDYGYSDITKFTEKVASNPRILIKEEQIEAPKKKKRIKLYEPLF